MHPNRRSIEAGTLVISVWARASLRTVVISLLLYTPIFLYCSEDRSKPLRTSKTNAASERANVGLKKLVKDIAKKIWVSEWTICKNLKKLRTKMSQIVRLNNKTHELVEGFMQIIPAAWIESLKAGNSNAKLETLKLAVRTYKDLMEILRL